MAQDVGGIEYTVSVDTKASIDAAKRFDTSMDSVQRTADKTDKSVGKLQSGVNKLSSDVRKANKDIAGTTSALNGLKGIIGGVIAVIGVRSIVEMADQYTEAASRIRQVTADTAEYEKVQARLLETANKTYRPLQEAQEVYIRTSSAIKDLGYNTDQALDITDSFSYLLVANAASAEKASSAINGYSKAIQTGKVDSLTWQSILSAMPTVVSDIAAATGETEQKIRELGITGKLSLQALNEALLRSRDNNEKLADAMDTTVGDAIVALKNSMQVFVAEVNKSSGATNGLVEAIELVSAKLQDPATIEAAQTLAAGVATAFVTAIEAIEWVMKKTEEAAVATARAVNGVGLHDVDGMKGEIENLTQRVELLNGELNRTRLMRINPFKSDEDLNKEINEIVAQIEVYQSAIDDVVKAEEMQAAAREKAERQARLKAASEEWLAEVSAEAEKQVVAAAKEKEAADKAAEKSAKDLAKAQQDNEKILLDLAEAIYQTTLSADELVKRQVELRMNSYATPEQIEHAQAMALQLKALNDEAERAKKFGDDVAATITGSVSPLSGGMFDDQTARYEAEADAEKQRYADAMERLQEAKDLELEVKGGYMALEEQMYQEHADRMAQIEKAKNDMIMNQAADAFGSMASNLQDYISVFGKENKTLMTMMKASAIAQTIIQTYQGAQQAFTAMSAIPVVGPALGVTAAAAAIAGGMARVASIRAQGTRRQGGPVSAGGMYRVNEGGKPEVFQNNLGQQYMIPNSRGEVISNKNASKGGTVSPVVVNLFEDSSRGGDVEQRQREDGSTEVNVFVSDIMSNGPRAKAMQRAYGLRRQGT